jgi:hypothetical protein
MAKLAFTFPNSTMVFRSIGQFAFDLTFAKLTPPHTRNIPPASSVPIGGTVDTA